MPRAACTNPLQRVTYMEMAGIKSAGLFLLSYNATRGWIILVSLFGFAIVSVGLR